MLTTKKIAATTELQLPEARLFSTAQINRISQAFLQTATTASLLDSVDTPVLVLTTKTRQIIAANTAFLKTFEYAPKEILGKHLEDCLPELSNTYTTTLSKKTISVYGCADLLQIVTFQAADIQRERKRLLVDIFVHDIRNSLGGLISLTNLVHTDARFYKDSEILDVLQTHVENKLRLLSLLNHSEDLAAETLFAPTDISLGIQKTIDLYAVLEQRLQIEFIADKPLIINTNADILSQIFENILKNACEGTASGGTITVSIQDHDSAVTIAVNNPTYMQPEDQARIFKEKFSIKGLHRGIGTKSIKLLTEEYLCGHVGFTSSMEEGTTFTVTLPKISE